MICRVCGSTLPEGAAFCTTCGTPVGQAPGQESTGEKQNNTVNCPVCGAPCDSSAYACSNCGNILGGAPRGYNPGSYNNQAYRPAGINKPKSRIAAGVLALVFGGIGIHNFYLGYNSKGIAQLVLAFFSCGVISGIWALVEAIMIFSGSINTDANGVWLE